MNKAKLVFLFFWVALLLFCIYSYFFNSLWFQSLFVNLFSATLLGWIIYLILSSLRGFTLIPATYFVLAGIPFLPPLPLFLISMVGIVISSLIVYNFAGTFGLYKFFERRYKNQIHKLRKILIKEEVPIVISWVILPVVPVDVISYVCGILKASKTKLVIGLIISEGMYFGLLIFLGKHLLGLF